MWRQLDRNGRTWLVLAIALASLVVPAAIYGIVMLLVSLWHGIVRAGAWPEERVAACSADTACVLSAIFTDGFLVWLAFLWLATIVAIRVYAGRLPQVPGTAKTIAKKRAAQRTAEGQRVGRAVGWALVLSLFGFLLVLVFVPLAAGVVALVTWSKERRDACSADPLCVISAIPGNALPAWIAFIWIAIIIAALVICWKPSRWWLPDAEARRHVKVRTYTSPDWIMRHALIAALISVGCLFGIYSRGNDVYSLGYIWVILAALTVAALAAVCKRKYGMRTPLDVKLSLMLTATAMSGVGDRRWGKLQRELHPRPARKRKKEDVNDA